MSLLKANNITPIAGYDAIEREMQLPNIDYSTLTLVDMDNSAMLYCVADNIYLYENMHHKKASYYVYKSVEYSKKDIRAIIASIKNRQKVYYYNFMIRTSNYFKGRKIECLHTHHQYADIAQGINEKIRTHKDMHINLLLHGNPGTGKSQYIEHLATLTGRNVYLVPTLEYEGFEDSIKNVSNRHKAIILIPEIDKSLDANGQIRKNETPLLELLNGCYTPRNAIIVMTCNDIMRVRQNRILIRPGRVHFQLEFGLVTAAHIDAIVEKYYPGATHSFVAGKMTVSEFTSAIESHYIMGKSLDEPLAITQIAQEKRSNLYL